LSYNISSRSSNGSAAVAAGAAAAAGHNTLPQVQRAATPGE